MPRIDLPARVQSTSSLIQEVLKTRTTAEWLERLGAAEVPCAPALTRNEVIRHPQVVASELLVETCLLHLVGKELRSQTFHVHLGTILSKLGSILGVIH